MNTERPIQASTAGIMAVCLLLVVNASVDVDTTGPSVEWSAAKVDVDSLKFDFLSRIALRINESYMEPARIDPREMFTAAMRAIEQRVPTFMVMEPGIDTDRFVLIDGERQMTISPADITSLWQTVFHISDVLKMVYLGSRLNADELKRLEASACQAILGTLDDHSTLLSEADLFELKQNTLGRFGGIGVVIAARKNALQILEVMTNTPAHRAGLKPKDFIVEIDQDTTQNLSLEEAAELLRGPNGSLVSLKIRSHSSQSLRVVKLKRSRISVESVTAKKLKADIGYLKIDHFQEHTTQEIEMALQTWRGSMRGLIIDLRDNPGGLLDQAIDISDLFLSKGTIVSTLGYQRLPTKEHRATERTANEDTNIVVLVDEHSASASEILAAALKDNRRALVFGRPTYGKGSVQLLFEFPENWGLKITVAQYLTPNKVSIQGTGLAPDVYLYGLNPEQADVKKIGRRKRASPQQMGSLRINYLGGESFDDKDPEVEIARHFLVSLYKEHTKTTPMLLEKLVTQLQSEYAEALGTRFKDKGLNWRTPSCDQSAMHNISMTFKGPSYLSTDHGWRPEIELQNFSPNETDILKLIVQSGDTETSFHVGSIKQQSNVTVQAPTHVMLTAQNGKCIALVQLENLCGQKSEPKDVVFECAGADEIEVRANMTFSDREHGNGNGVLEFNERGTFRLQLIGNQFRQTDRVSATLTLKGPPRDRPVKLINGIAAYEFKHALDSKNEGGLSTPIELSFDFEAKRNPHGSVTESQDFILEITDELGRVMLYQELTLQVYPNEPNSLQRSKRERYGHLAQFVEGTQVHFQPSKSSELIAKTGGTLLILGQRNDWYLIKVAQGYGWIHEDQRDHITSTNAESQASVEPQFHSAGKINFDPAPVITSDSNLVVRGTFSGIGLLDYRFFHNGKKTTYAQFTDADVVGQPFEAKLSLTPGVNRVDAILRSTQGYEKIQTMYVTQRTQNN